LEVVDVQQGQAIPATIGDRAFERRAQRAPVGQPGQRVLQDLFAKVGVAQRQLGVEAAQLRFVPVALLQLELQFARHPAQLELRRHLARKRFERLQLVDRQPSRDPVHHAQRAHRQAVGIEQGRPGVEAHAGLAGDEGIVVEPGVLERVGHHEYATSEDRMAAEGQLTRGLGDLQPMVRLEPLAFGIDEGDRPHRHSAHRRRDRDQVVVGGFRAGIEDAKGLHGREPLLLVLRYGRSLHAPSLTGHVVSLRQCGGRPRAGRWRPDTARLAVTILTRMEQACAAVVEGAAHRGNAVNAGKVHWVVTLNRRNRSLFFALGLFVLGTHLAYLQAGPLMWTLLALQLLVYPQLVYWHAARSPDPLRAELQNLLIDGVLLGAWIAVMGLPLWISFVLFVGVCLNVVIFMGMPGLWKGVASLAAGVAAVAAVHGLEFRPHTELHTSLLCIVLLTAYLLFFANAAYRRGVKLRDSRRELGERLEQITALQSQLQEQAQRDPLTGLHNRRF